MNNNITSINSIANGFNKTAKSVLPNITVMGVGGGGANVVNSMVEQNVEGVTFISANTDLQSLVNSSADKIIQLGKQTTKGLGSGSDPEIGRIAAEEALSEIQDEIKSTNMLFLVFGAGGGTGTGAGPVIAKKAKEMGILTVAIVTTPFEFEGNIRRETAKKCIDEIEKEVDSLIVLPNQNLFSATEKTTSVKEAFKVANGILVEGVRNITGLMVQEGFINLDFADIRSVMTDKGRAVIGIGEAEGENRALESAEQAVVNKLLSSETIFGAKGVLVNISGAEDDIKLNEVSLAMARIREEVGDDSCNLIFGTSFDEALKGKMKVSLIAAGFDKNQREDLNFTLSSASSNKENPASFNKDLSSQNLDDKKDEGFKDDFSSNDSFSNPFESSQENSSFKSLDDEEEEEKKVIDAFGNVSVYSNKKEEISEDIFAKVDEDENISNISEDESFDLNEDEKTFLKSFQAEDESPVEQNLKRVIIEDKVVETIEQTTQESSDDASSKKGFFSSLFSKPKKDAVKKDIHFEETKTVTIQQSQRRDDDADAGVLSSIFNSHQSDEDDTYVEEPSFTQQKSSPVIPNIDFGNDVEQHTDLTSFSQDDNDDDEDDDEFENPFDFGRKLEESNQENSNKPQKNIKYDNVSSIKNAEDVLFSDLDESPNSNDKKTKSSSNNEEESDLYDMIKKMEENIDIPILFRKD